MWKIKKHFFKTVLDREIFRTIYISIIYNMILNALDWSRNFEKLTARVFVFFRRGLPVMSWLWLNFPLRLPRGKNFLVHFFSKLLLGRLYDRGFDSFFCFCDAGCDVPAHSIVFFSRLRRGRIWSSRFFTPVVRVLMISWGCFFPLQ